MQIETKFEIGQTVLFEGEEMLIKEIHLYVKQSGVSALCIMDGPNGWAALPDSQLTPIEPPPAADDLDARARELIAEWNEKGYGFVYVAGNGMAVPFRLNHTVSSYMHPTDSDEALAAVRAHLAAQEKGEADGKH